MLVMFRIDRDMSVRPCVTRTCISLTAWSVDGQLLAVSKASGGIFVYLTKISMLASVWEQKVAYMASLCEVSIYDHQTKTKVNSSESRDTERERETTKDVMTVF
jgi:hypothetical protein